MCLQIFVCRALASNESLQVVARKIGQLRREDLHSPEGSTATSWGQSAAVSAPSGNEKTAEPLKLEASLANSSRNKEPRSRLQQVFGDRDIALPHGEVLLCRALLHAPIADLPLGYTSEEAPGLLAEGPSKETIGKAKALQRKASA